MNKERGKKIKIRDPLVHVRQPTFITKEEEAKNNEEYNRAE